MGRIRFSIDLGETFTDFVIMEESGLLHIKKIPTTLHEPTADLTREIGDFVRHSSFIPDQIGSIIVGVSVRMLPEQISACIRDLEQELRQAGWKATIYLVTSEGRLLGIEQAAEKIAVVLAPSRIGGILTGRYFGAQIGSTHLILTRIGGTNTYVSVLPNATGKEMLAAESRDLNLTIGGNSLIGLDADGSLAILPDHVDHQIGPACFNRGGTRPTLTDIDLQMGFLNKDYFLYGAIPLNPAASYEAIERHLARPLNISVEEAALRVSQGMEKHLASAIRKLCGEPTESLGDYIMLAFGGAGPVHAAEIAGLLGVHQVVVPVGSGVASALGYLLIPPPDDPDWKLPATVRRAGYYNAGKSDIPALKGYRRVYYEKDLTPCSCPIYDRAGIRAEDSLSGPGVIEGPETTVVIRDKTYAQMDTLRNLRIHLR